MTAQDSPGAFRLVASMAGVGFAAGVLIVVSYQATLAKIRRNKEEALREAVLRVVPGARRLVAFSKGADGRLARGEGAETYYACYGERGELAGMAIEAQGQGFQDTIRLLYGYSPRTERIVGFEVLESKETPGLGDKIDSDRRFKENFRNLDVKHPIKLAKHGEKTQEWEIEAITGATVSSRAVEAILKASLAAAVPLIRESLPALEQGGRE